MILLQVIIGDQPLMKLIKYLTFAVALITLQGCANPSIVNISPNANNIISNASTIYIPRFEGNPNFVEEGTDYYISVIENKINCRVIQGSALRLEKTDIESGGNLAPITIALEVAKQNGANILIMGKITSYSSGGNTLTNNGVAVSSNIAFVDFADLTFSSVTLTAVGALIYKGTSNEAVLVLDFGGSKTATTRVSFLVDTGMAVFFLAVVSGMMATTEGSIMTFLRSI